MNGYGQMGSYMGMAQGALNIAGGQMMKKGNRQIRRTEDTMRQRGENYRQQELGLQEQDVNRGANEATQATLGNANDNGVVNSSIPGAENQKIELDRQRRFNQISAQRSQDASNFYDQSKIIRAQRQQQKMKDMMSLINGGIEGGANGAADAYSQRTY